MRLSAAALVLFLANAYAFAPPPLARRSAHTLGVLAVAEETEQVLTVEDIGEMSFRELQNKCRERGLPPDGTTATLRARIREYICPADPFTGEEECPTPEVSHQ